MPEYGTVDDFEKLVKGMHRNVKLIIDLVINHTSISIHGFLKQQTISTGWRRTDATECPLCKLLSVQEQTEAVSFYRIGDSDWYYEAVFLGPDARHLLEQQKYET